MQSPLLGHAGWLPSSRQICGSPEGQAHPWGGRSCHLTFSLETQRRRAALAWAIQLPGVLLSEMEPAPCLWTALLTQDF